MRKNLLLLITSIIQQASFAQSPFFDWANHMEGFGKFSPYAIETDALGNIYTCGLFSDSADFNPGVGSFVLSTAGLLDINGFITKHDASGNFIWAKQIKGVSASAAITHININPTGDIFLTGNFNGSKDFDPGANVFNLTSTGNDVFILKLDAVGNFVWAKVLNSNYECNASRIVTDAVGNIFVSGYFTGITDFDPGAGISNFTSTTLTYMDAYVLKLDASGNYLWVKTFGGIADDFIYGMCVNTQGDVFVSGLFTDAVDFDPGAGVYNISAFNTFYSDAFVMRLSNAGNFVWAKTIGNSFNDYSSDLEIDNAGNLYISGNYWGTVDFDPGAAQYFLSGGTSYVLRLDSLGGFAWATSFNADIKSITIDNLSDVYATGSFSGSVDFDPGVGTNFLTSITTQDMFILSLNTFGNYKWAEKIYGTSTLYGHDITTDNLNKVLTVGKFDGTIDFDFGTGVYNLTGTVDGFIHKLHTEGTTYLTEQHPDKFNITLFPNPASNNIRIHFPINFALKSLTIISKEGAVLEKRNIDSTKELLLDISSYAQGIYFLMINDIAGNVQWLKIAKK
ncbi:MAG TPA: T9SS type A sorting domain-containing protein [Bacteroidia bacterium]|nr:T9SS type A sorting domain-containing protein [Bacteroidia bacterium]HNU33268.1 T9SS type A sorting domain-containing protein [Bacteroidia bacterium]